jgi:uncharacterized protein YdbL (DUF1318 family)
MRKNLKNIFVLLMVSITVGALNTFALSLDEAKTRGLVGEDTTGYLGAVNPAPEVSALVKDINAKRREMYKEIAKKNGTAVGAVEALAGEKAIAQTPAGQFVRGSGGSWKKK